MHIIVDTREQLPFTFDKYQCSIIKACLPVGDYSILGFEERIAIERKSPDDLVNCCMGADRIRFEKELAKAKAFEHFVVMIECSYADLAQGKYRSKMQPKSVVQTITDFWIRHGVSFIFAGSRNAAEYLTFSFLEKYLYEIEKRYKTATGKAA